MPGLMDEVKKKINRPVPDLPLSDDTDILLQPAAAARALDSANGNGNWAATEPATANRASRPLAAS